MYTRGMSRTIKALSSSSAFMMSAALVLSLATNHLGIFPSETFDASARSTVTILLLAAMMTVSLSRVPTSDLRPDRAVLRSLVLGLLVSSAIPIAGYLLLRNGTYADASLGWVFIAATPFAASVAPLSFVLRGDIKHACKSTIYVYIASLVWIPLVIYALIGEMVNMGNVIITVLEIIGIPLILSRLLARFEIPRDLMAIALNLIIGFLVWLSVSPTDFGGIGVTVFAVFIGIAVCRTFLLGNAVEFTERRMGIHWQQRVTDILVTSYKNKGIAIALCVSVLSGPLIGQAMIAITVSIVVEICWVVFMDSVLFSRRRMERELEREGTGV